MKLDLVTGRAQQEKTPNQVIEDRLNSWLENPPDYYTVVNAFDTLGNLRKQARVLRRQITEIEDKLTIDADKPRGAEVKKQIIIHTQDLQEELATIEAEIEVYDVRVKKLEYIRHMYASSTFALKAKTDMK